MNIRYYGCGPVGIGHYFHKTTGERDYLFGDAACPWRYAVDGRLQPRIGPDTRLPRSDGTALADYRPEAPQGVCAVHRLDGWTCVAWWDRSADTRGASNSSIVIDDPAITFDALIALARHEFPWVFARIRFELTLAAP